MCISWIYPKQKSKKLMLRPSIVFPLSDLESFLIKSCNETFLSFRDKELHVAAVHIHNYRIYLLRFLVQLCSCNVPISLLFYCKYLYFLIFSVRILCKPSTLIWLILLSATLCKFAKNVELSVHCKKRWAISPSPAGMSLPKLSLAGNN
jgi:hypothetical protein